MADFKIITLNDAIYRILQKPKSWYDDKLGNDEAIRNVLRKCFTKASCPSLYTFGKNRVVTWKDFIMLLGGWPNSPLMESFTNSCFRVLINEPNIHYEQHWGQTYGEYKGKNGKPLCESKILDESLFYYENSSRSLILFYDWNHKHPYASPASIMEAWYVATVAGNWNFFYRKDGIGSNNYKAIMLLDPGVYLAYNSPYYDTSTYFEHSFYGSNTSNFIGITGMNATNNPNTTYRVVNTIFFVDSPIYTFWHYTLGAKTSLHEAHFGLFRITPPGYWIP